MTVAKEKYLKALDELVRYADIGRQRHGATGCDIDSNVFRAGSHRYAEHYILLPKDIKKEHDKLMKLVKVKKDKDSKEKFFKAYKKLLKYVYSSGNFVIIPCECLSDLEKESEVLNHCVKSYAQRYQDQKTNIMFVRDVHEVTKPYATLEFRGNKVIQFRAKGNKRPSNEAVSFVREWANMNKLECNLWTMN